MTDFLSDLISAATATDGQPPFSDQSLVDLAAGSRRLITVGAGSAGAISVGAASIDTASIDAAEGAALVTTADGDTEAELVVHPDARRRGLGEHLLLDVIASSTGTLLVWAHGDHPAARVLAGKHGFEPVRELLQLRMEVGEASRGLSSSRSERIETSGEGPDTRWRATRPAVAPFRPGTDDAAWLDLNARAFADHAEQGKLTQVDLDARKAESWFNAGDFLLLWDREELIGFCWLKVDGELGEFYAVGVSPSRQGEGIGRMLVEAGLHRLAERGIRTSNLYVEGDNEPAVRLYRSYGFRNHTVDVQYRRAPVGSSAVKE